MEFTTNTIERIRRDFVQYAKEDVTVEVIGGVIYAFGSELACYRIHYKYRLTDQSRVQVKYSENRQSWFFSLEPQF